MVELSPELISTLINNGLGGLSIILLWQMSGRLSRLVNAHNDHARRIARLERKAGIEEDPPRTLETHHA